MNYRLTALICVASILLNGLLLGEISKPDNENKFCNQIVKRSNLLTNQELSLLKYNDAPAGSDIYVFPHEKVIGLIVGGLAALLAVRLLTKNRPLF